MTPPATPPAQPPPFVPIAFSFTYECEGYIEAASCAAAPPCRMRHSANQPCFLPLPLPLPLTLTLNFTLTLTLTSPCHSPPCRVIRCVADPSCGWCADAKLGGGTVGCLPCEAEAGAEAEAEAAVAAAAEGGVEAGRPSSSSSSSSSPAAVATCSDCVLLSRRRTIVLGPNWVSVTGSLRRGEFAVLQLDPPHTNVALRLALHYAPPHAISLVARKDLPPRVGHRPAHGAAQPPREVLSKRGDSPRLLSIPGRELGCGQRDGRRSEGAWPDLVVQREQGWSALQREQVGPPFLPPS